MSKSNQTKYLNLDEIAPPKKIIRLKGEEHEMRHFSVGEFIEVLKRGESQDEIDRLEKRTESERFEWFVNQIRDAFPTMTDTTLKGLSLEQVTAIWQFTRDALEEGSEESEDAEAKKKT
jgi:methyl coenzyme M reductase subunit D